MNLKRNRQDRYEAIDKAVVDKYFSGVTPSESKKTLKDVSRDLFDLIQHVKGCPEVTSMYNSYQLLERVLKKHWNLTADKDVPVKMKEPKAIPSDSLQNPSDPDFTYSSYKGQG